MAEISLVQPAMPSSRDRSMYGRNTTSLPKCVPRQADQGHCICVPRVIITAKRDAHYDTALLMHILLVGCCVRKPEGQGGFILEVQQPSD